MRAGKVGSSFSPIAIVLYFGIQHLSRLSNYGLDKKLLIGSKLPPTYVLNFFLRLLPFSQNRHPRESALFRRISILSATAAAIQID